jgi:glycosyltransferase involved in cell wall biosynthesis
MEPRVSVVMPVYDGGEVFRTCLDSVLRCSPPADEVIVVSDGSTDGTDDAARERGVTLIRLPGNGGPSRARNAGVAAATGDVMFFVDADVSVPPDAVARVKRHFAEPGAADAVFGCYDDAPAAPQFVSQYRNLLHHYVHLTGSEEAGTFWSGLGAVRRAAFLEAGGFNEGRRFLEDVELGYRLRAAGRRIRLEKSLQGKHHKRWTAWGMLKTDVLGRALPWTELTWEYGKLPKDLNVRTSARWSAALAGLAPVLALASIFLPGPWRIAGLAAAFVAALLLVLTNRGFYGCLRRKRGTLFAAASIPLHWAYFVYAGATFAICSAWFALTRRPRAEPPAAVRPLPGPEA